MIIVRLKNGMGNQLFQYALGRFLAYKHKTKLKLDLTDYENSADSHHAYYKLGAFNIKENFATESDIKSVKFITQEWEDAWVFLPEILDLPDNILLDGWWQCEKYFDEIADIIKREFRLKRPLGKISSEWKKKILESDCSVSIHVRHGDFLFYRIRNSTYLLSPKHYAYCIEKLKESYRNIKVFVFSDDLQWCRDNFHFDVPTEFVEGCEHDYEELYLMSCCKHNIISRGTFAWWGAWLNPNPDKKIFTPLPWHMTEVYGKDVIPESWIKVPTKLPHWVSPMLSIIVYIDNNLTMAKLMLNEIKSQIMSDYEVIFLDASDDGSGNICRQFAGNIKTNILNLDYDTKKFTAWNRGLNIARGDYVLFLSTEDVIFPHTSQVLSVTCELSIKARANNQKNYITYSTFGNYIPNIINSVSRLEEDDNGQGKINGIPDKKFSVKVDTGFEKLNNIAELNLTAQQKLMALGSNGINGFVGTKFFKRTFLEENHIRFNEGEGVDAELAFIVNAFMATEKITFVPQLFYGRLK